MPCLSPSFPRVFAAFVLAAAVPGCAGLSDAPPPEPPGNLLRNGSFEEWTEAGPVDWEILHSPLGQRLELAGGAAHGRHDVSITCFQPEEFVFLRQTVPLAGPGTYRASLVVRPRVATRSGLLVVKPLDKDAKEVGTPAVAELLGQDGEWRPVAVNLRPPTEAAALRYEIRVGPNSAGNLEIDLARLELLPPPPKPKEAPKPGPAPKAK